MDMDKAEFVALTIELLDSGYAQRAPTGAEIDRESIDGLTCPDCDGKLSFRPFYKPGSYRAFAVCIKCGAYEF